MDWRRKTKGSPRLNSECMFNQREFIIYYWEGKKRCFVLILFGNFAVLNKTWHGPRGRGTPSQPSLARQKSGIFRAKRGKKLVWHFWQILPPFLYFTHTPRRKHTPRRNYFIIATPPPGEGLENKACPRMLLCLCYICSGYFSNSLRSNACLPIVTKLQPTDIV